MFSNTSQEVILHKTEELQTAVPAAKTPISELHTAFCCCTLGVSVGWGKQRQANQNCSLCVFQK